MALLKVICWALILYYKNYAIWRHVEYKNVCSVILHL